jgi:hypothetical protein
MKKMIISLKVIDQSKANLEATNKASPQIIPTLKKP